jgi:hypothetical protein
MEKKILEELKRFRLLSNYDSNKTHDENSQLLDEQFRTIVRDVEVAKTLGSDLEKVMAGSIEGGAFVTKQSKTLRTSEEVLQALKAGLFTETEAARVYWNVFRKTDNPATLKKIAEAAVESKTFQKNYGSLNKEAFIREIKGKKNISTKQAEELWKANSRRITNTEKEFKTTAQQTDDVIEPIGSQKETVNPGSQSAQKQTQKVQEEMRPEKSWWDDFFNKRKVKDRRKFFENRQNREKVVKIMKERGGIWDKVFKWGKRSILFSGLIGLAKLGLVGFGIWWLYDMFKDMGFDVDCDDPEEEMVYGFGCRKRKGGGGENEDEEKKKEKEEEIKKPDDNLKKAQKCLGIEQTGFLDQKTEDALYKKINKRTFDPNDLPKICEKPFSSVEFQI